MKRTNYIDYGPLQIAKAYTCKLVKICQNFALFQIAKAFTYIFILILLRF